MKWIVDGRWRKDSTGKVYRAKFFVITDKSTEDPIAILNEHYDLSGMTYLDGYVTRENECRAALIEPFVEEKA